MLIIHDIKILEDENFDIQYLVNILNAPKTSKVMFFVVCMN